MSNSYTYCYRDPSRNNERIYVGKGLGRRAWTHLKRTDAHPLTHRLQKMKRGGVEPVIEFLCTGVDDELACLVEVEAISLYGRKDLGKGPLLNLTDGGDGTAGVVVSEETRAKTRAWMTGRKVGPNRPETIEKRRQSLLGKKQHPSHTANCARGHQRPCSVDGATYFDSYLSLVAALGRGKQGERHPNFHYISGEEHSRLLTVRTEWSRK